MEVKIHELSNVLEHLRPHTAFEIWGIPVTTTVVNTWLVMAVLFGLVFLLTRNLGKMPHGKQTFLEATFDFLFGIIDEAIGKEGRRYLPLIASVFIFIIFLNFAWFIPGMLPPTVDLSTTAALAVTTIIIVHVIGIKRRGLRSYIRHFAEPTPLMIPMNILEELIKPFSLALRLFGNLFGGEMVIAILSILVPLFLPIPIMFLEVLMGVVQAFIFALLTATYIGASLSSH